MELDTAQPLSEALLEPMHDLRHEYASWLVERGAPLAQVRHLLRHASIATRLAGQMGFELRATTPATGVNRRRD